MNKKSIQLLVIGLCSGFGFDASAEWLIRKTVWDHREIIHDVEEVHARQAVTVKESPIVLRDIPEVLQEGKKPSERRYQEVVYASLNDVSQADLKRYFARQPQVKRAHNRLAENADVRTLIKNGDINKKVNITTVGDGYTANQKEKFFDDALRVVGGMFSRGLKPFADMINLHAVFVPSNDSGITDIERKDTALGLYRTPKGSKRGILLGKPSEAQRAVDLAPRTNYPMLLANDDFYGGLGGRWLITTRSHESGVMVGDHEGGHNFASVGEEYDGGQAYFGANFAWSTSRMGWSDLIDGPVHESDADGIIISYPWTRLDKGEQRFAFTFPKQINGKDRLFDLDLSSVGWSTKHDVDVLLNGERVELKGLFTKDRSFFKAANEIRLKPGKHELIVRNAGDKDNILASVKLRALAPDHDFTPNRLGAYTVIDSDGFQRGYRPTNNSCLMRDMRKTAFCLPCKRSIKKNFDRIINWRAP